MTVEIDLQGTGAIVTGGGRGIGRAIATELAAAGAHVVPAARSEAEIDAVAESIRENGGSATAVPVDVTDPTAIDDLVATARERCGSVDVVVNNAGINPDGALGTPDDLDIESASDVVDVNLEGALRVASAAAEVLAANGGGVLVNVASVGGLVGLPRQHPYVASKHGLVGITKSLALDWAPTVRVNAVAPGYVLTEMTEDIESTDHVRESILAQTPLDRFADPEEIADPVVFLASEMASYVTGACLAVDGGWTAR